MRLNVFRLFVSILPSLSRRATCETSARGEFKFKRTCAWRLRFHVGRQALERGIPCVGVCSLIYIIRWGQSLRTLHSSRHLPCINLASWRRACGRARGAFARCPAGARVPTRRVACAELEGVRGVARRGQSKRTSPSSHDFCASVARRARAVLGNERGEPSRTSPRVSTRARVRA